MTDNATREPRTAAGRALLETLAGGEYRLTPEQEAGFRDAILASEAQAAAQEDWFERYLLYGRDGDGEQPRTIVDEQAEDDGLWFIATTAPEAYLQQELRRLHAAIKAAPLPVSVPAPLDVERLLVALEDEFDFDDMPSGRNPHDSAVRVAAALAASAGSVGASEAEEARVADPKQFSPEVWTHTFPRPPGPRPDPAPTHGAATAAHYWYDDHGVANGGNIPERAPLDVERLAAGPWQFFAGHPLPWAYNEGSPGTWVEDAAGTVLWRFDHFDKAEAQAFVAALNAIVSTEEAPYIRGFNRGWEAAAPLKEEGS